MRNALMKWEQMKSSVQVEHAVFHTRRCPALPLAPRDRHGPAEAPPRSIASHYPLPVQSEAEGASPALLAAWDTAASPALP